MNQENKSDDLLSAMATDWHYKLVTIKQLTDKYLGGAAVLLGMGTKSVNEYMATTGLSFTKTDWVILTQLLQACVNSYFFKFLSIYLIFNLNTWLFSD